MHLGEYLGGQEKCVDIALAVDMMHYATVPNAFDIAVLLSGDRDFIPALVRTRQKGKRVAVCSMRSSASGAYDDHEANIKGEQQLAFPCHPLATPLATPTCNTHLPSLLAMPTWNAYLQHRLR